MRFRHVLFIPILVLGLLACAGENPPNPAPTNIPATLAPVPTSAAVNTLPPSNSVATQVPPPTNATLPSVTPLATLLPAAAVTPIDTPLPQDTVGATLPTNIPVGAQESLAAAQDTPTSTPTATQTPPPPFVFFASYTGNMGVDARWDETGLYIRVNANDIQAGQDDGVGIDHVDIFIQDLNGNVIASKRENRSPYCFFSEEQGDCKQIQAGTAEFKWRDGKPIQPGYYLVRAVAYTPDRRIQIDERFLNITLPVQTLENLFVNFDQPGDSQVSNQLEYQVSPSGGQLEPGTGDAIDRVEMFIVDYSGKKVSARTENDPNYCGFGDGGLNTPCNVYNFAAKNYRWPSGDPILPTQYLFRAIVFTKLGHVRADDRVVEITGVPRPGSSSGGNGSHGNFAILADGQNDVAQVHRALVFRTFAGDNGNDGDNIDHVEMSVLDGTGNVVVSRSEATPRYCAFGGNEQCNSFVFASENNRWPDGSSILDNGTYTLQAKIFFRSGKSPQTISKDIVVFLQ